MRLLLLLTLIATTAAPASGDEVNSILPVPFAVSEVRVYGPSAAEKDPPVLVIPGSSGSYPFSFSVGGTTGTGSLSATQAGDNGVQVVLDFEGDVSGPVLSMPSIEMFGTISIPKTVVGDGNIALPTTAFLERSSISQESTGIESWTSTFAMITWRNAESTFFNGALPATLGCGPLDPFGNLYYGPTVERSCLSTLAGPDSITTAVRFSFYPGTVSGYVPFNGTFTVNYELSYLPEPSPPLALGMGAGLLAMLGRVR